MLRRSSVYGLAALVAFASVAPVRANAQGVTTGGVAGTVTASGGQPVANVQIEVRNPTTGFRAGALTRSNGQYQVMGLAPDNYVVSARRIGYAPQTRDPVRVTLGEMAREDFTLEERAAVLGEVTISGTVDPIINATKTGTGTTISDSAIARMPTLNRNFTDFVRMVPQVSTTTGFISGGGVNPRQNAIQIDGAQAGDMFGLGATGQPGSQANAKSIPLDAVKEYQVLLSPFDVRQGHFGGLLINAVTKSGTNQLRGSVYGYSSNQSMRRKQEYLTDFTQRQYGFALGGPIIRDRLFFFVNPEFQDMTTPAAGPYVGSTNPRAPISQASIEQFAAIAAGYGLADPGHGDRVLRENPTSNVFARLDAFLPFNTRAVLRHNYAAADNTVFGRSNPATTSTPNFNLTSNRYEFSNKSNSTVLELLTTVRNGIFNELLLNRAEINDFRTVPVRFPMITVQGIQRSDTSLANARIVAGTEASSQGNSLDQKTFEITNNITIPHRAHSFTVGGKLLNYRPVNLFAQNSLGSWTFTNIGNFQNGIASNYAVSAPAPTDPAGGIATFRASMYSLYLQDRWTVLPNLTVTGGVRYDKPDFRDRPPHNEPVAREYSRSTSSVPARAQWSPRLAFNWDVNGDAVNQVRGGIGYFTGSVPFVYLSNAFGNSGLSGYAALTCNGTTSGTFSQAVPVFNQDNIANPPTSCAPAAGKQGATVAVGGNINTIDPDFKFPQYRKITVAYDRRLAFGLVGTLEALHTYAINNVFYQNLALAGPRMRVDQTGQSVFHTDPNGRVMYGNLTATGSAPVYVGSRTQVLDATNASGDNILAMTAQLHKSFTKNYEARLAYTNQRARDVTSTTSSTAGSNYRYQRSVKGDILSREVSRSKNDQPHRVLIGGTYRSPWKTDISVAYSGSSGAPFDYVYGSNGGSTGDLNADGQTQNDLLYVPTEAEIGDGTNGTRIRFTGWNGTATQQQQARDMATAFNSYVEDMDCLRNARGAIMNRNSCRNPWINQVDVSIAQNVTTFRGQNAQVRLDIVNFTNLLNKEWGAQQFSDQGSTCGSLCGSTILVTHTGTVLPAGTTPSWERAIPVVSFTNTEAFTSRNASSNYRMQLSVRYSF
jgi:outer membrane receptor protein involved in Fe transport